MNIYENLDNSKAIRRGLTGLIYNEVMTKHKCPWDDNYPECPERIKGVWERIVNLRLDEFCTKSDGFYADDAELLKLHEERLLDTLKNVVSYSSDMDMESVASQYDAIYFNKHTLACARFAAGSALNLVSGICTGMWQNGMAVIRPPGHHAEKNKFVGYCYFNNIALAALKCLETYKKVLIVDWDVHHGQATQQMFYDDPRVLYFSIHRYEHGKFWPNLRESNFDYIGNGCGEGYNINIPLNETGLGDGDYLAIFQQVLLPVALEFGPDLILISAGYDAAVGCPEGEMLISPACYSHLIWSLMHLAFGRVAVILEGGYCLKSLAEGAALTLRALLGGRCPKLEDINPPSDSIKSVTLAEVIEELEQEYFCTVRAADVIFPPGAQSILW